MSDTRGDSLIEAGDRDRLNRRLYGGKTNLVCSCGALVVTSAARVIEHVHGHSVAGDGHHWLDRHGHKRVAE